MSYAFLFSKWRSNLKLKKSMHAFKYSLDRIISIFWQFLVIAFKYYRKTTLKFLWNTVETGFSYTDSYFLCKNIKIHLWLNWFSLTIFFKLLFQRNGSKKNRCRLYLIYYVVYTSVRFIVHMARKDTCIRYQKALRLILRICPSFGLYVLHHSVIRKIPLL